ncbi:MAG: hypothetical protein HY901_14725 [Deltaproteobacteria bacterium]|nr:hypothetical protein [Deltaproteobacteria bacterium]
MPILNEVLEEGLEDAVPLAPARWPRAGGAPAASALAWDDTHFLIRFQHRFHAAPRALRSVRGAPTPFEEALEVLNECASGSHQGCETRLVPWGWVRLFGHLASGWGLVWKRDRSDLFAFRPPPPRFAALPEVDREIWCWSEYTGGGLREYIRLVRPSLTLEEATRRLEAIRSSR